MMISEDIESRMRRALRAIADALPENDVDSILRLIDAREWGVAFENLCTQLYEYDVVVPDSVFNELAALGRKMRLDPQLWEILIAEVRPDNRGPGHHP